MFNLFLLVVFIGLVGYGLYALRGRLTPPQAQRLTLAALLAALGTLALLPGDNLLAQTATPGLSLDIDISPVFEAIMSYLPTFLALFGIIGGIGIAIALSRFIINSIRGAFSGKDV